MPRIYSLLLLVGLSSLMAGCNFSLTTVATGDADVVRANRAILLKPTCLSPSPKSIEKVELYDLKTKTFREIEPIFNGHGLYWTPTESMNSRYRFKFTCNGSSCFSPTFVVDGALSETGKALYYPREDSSSRDSDHMVAPIRRNR